MKKMLWIAFYAILIAFSFVILDTYALLKSKGNADINPTTGKWEILLNGIDVTDEKVLELNDLVFEENENVEPGYFAPGSTATYEIVIDPGNTDVSIRYDITIDLESLSSHPNIFFSAKDEENVEIASDGETYSGVISLSSIKNKEVKKIKIFLIWEHNEELNELDNKLNGITSLKIPITVKFSQYLGGAL